MNHARTRPLADIPNQEGFRFLGVSKGGDEWICVVQQKNPDGCYSVYREEDGVPCWSQLAAWTVMIEGASGEPKQ